MLTINVTAWLGTTLSTHGATALFLITLLEGLGLPIPTEVVLPLAGVLINRGILQLWPAIFAAGVGQMTGSLLLFGLGQYGGRPLLHRYGHFIRQQDLERVEHWFEHHGEGVVFFTRLFPGARTVVSLTAGISGMSLTRFLLYSTTGIGLWTTFLTLAGMKAGRAWEIWSGYIHLVTVILGIAAAIILAGYGWVRLRGKP